MRNEARAAVAIAAVLGGFVQAGGIGAAQPIAPGPAPTPACARPNLAPSVVQAAPPDTPPMAQQQGILGTVVVVVSLDRDSRVVGTRIRSSPSVLLNAAALAAARRSMFQTEIRDCFLIASDYVYTVDFGSKGTFSTSASGERTVTVVGQATIKRAPDVAYVQANIVTAEDAAADAVAKNDAAFAALSANLRALGIARGSIRETSPVRTLPAQSGSAARQYRTRQVEITADTVANAGHLAAAAASVPSVEAVAIRYALSERSSAYREALDAALKNAEQRAREAATDEHVRLGVLKYVAVSPNDRTPSPSAVEAFYLVPVIGGLTEPTISIPQIEVLAAATVTYAIKP